MEPRGNDLVGQPQTERFRIKERESREWGLVQTVNFPKIARKCVDMLIAGWEIRRVKNVREVPKPANNLFTFFLSLSNQFFNSFNLTGDIKKTVMYFQLSVESELKFGKCLFCKMHSIEAVCHDTRNCATSSKNYFTCCSRPDVKGECAYSLYIYIG